MQERLEKNVHAEQDGQDYEKVLEQIENGKIILYEKYKEGQIDRDEFVAGRNELNAQAAEIQKKMKEAALVFCQVLFPKKSVGIPFFQQVIFPAFSGHYASLRMRACSIR